MLITMINFIKNRRTLAEIVDLKVIHIYVKSQINEQVCLPLAAVHALRLRLSNNTNFSLVKVVTTLVQILARQFAEKLMLRYQWYVWWWQRKPWKNSGNSPNVSYRLGVTLLHLVLDFTHQYFGNQSLRRIDVLYGSDKSGQG